MLFTMLLTSMLGAQPAPAVDQAKVDAAIKKGVEYLKGAAGDLGDHKIQGSTVRYEELVLWTFVHAGVPESDATFQKLFKTMMEGELRCTYGVSLQAMILEELDRVKHQARIHQCAQFLVDNQARNGQWSYGTPSPFVKDVPTGAGRREDVATGVGGDAPGGRRPKPPIKQRVRVTKRRDGPDYGDNSNSQYAALGLRACHDAGVDIPKDVVRSAQRWWTQSQHDAPKTKDAYPGRGWCYAGKDHGHAAYGSMTAGAVGALILYHYMLREPWKNDRAIETGLEWLASHFSVRENVGPPEYGGGTGWMYYYYLYALERVGILAGQEKIGGHEWYPEGAVELIKSQQADGSWHSPVGSWGVARDRVWDTCFAILFLRRATRPLEDVATGDRTKK